MSSAREPSIRRDLIRFANRDNLSSEDVNSIIWMTHNYLVTAEKTGEPVPPDAARTLYRMWKESFYDVEP